MSHTVNDRSVTSSPPPPPPTPSPPPPTPPKPPPTAPTTTGTAAATAAANANATATATATATIERSDFLTIAEVANTTVGAETPPATSTFSLRETDSVTTRAVDRPAARATPGGEGGQASSRYVVDRTSTWDPLTDLVVYADGSYSDHDQAGGAGVAFQQRDGRWSGRAVALGRVRNNNAAELHAIYEAIKVAQEVVGHRFRIIIRTDSETCLRWIAEDKGSHSELRTLVEMIHDERMATISDGVLVFFRWVRGHSEVAGINLADQLAKHGRMAFRGGPRLHWNIDDLSASGPPSFSPFSKEEMRRREEVNKEAAEYLTWLGCEKGTSE